MPTIGSRKSCDAKYDAIERGRRASALHAFTIVEVEGNLFAAPKNTLLIHACNAEGKWGAGIASDFKKHYPTAFKVYRQHCLQAKKDNRSILGTSLLIPPQDDNDQRHFIGCLFTSQGYGKGKSSTEQILQMTSLAMKDLAAGVHAVNQESAQVISERNIVDDWRMCRINAGLFKVPWEKTIEAITSIALNDLLSGIDETRTITVVVSPESRAPPHRAYRVTKKRKMKSR